MENPHALQDGATYEHLHQYSTGARTSVIVNGTPVVEDATHTGALPGKVLRRDGEGGLGDAVRVSSAAQRERFVL